MSTEHKPIRKKRIQSKVESRRDEDIERLKSVARVMLARLEQELQQNASLDDEWLFGPKNSLISGLISLAELILKLQNTSSREGSAPAVNNEKLTPADLVLMKEFLLTHQD
jgi:hypothetical protein